MDKKNIVVLSYAAPHRKTYDTLLRLKAKGYSNVTVYARPYSYIKKYKPLIQHRPVSYGFDTMSLCQNLGYGYRAFEDEFPELESDAIVLLAGAGLIPNEVVKRYTIINAHPGYVPEVRGLDALKWAVIENKPIGCTTHILGDEIDAGFIIERKEVPVYASDTFHAVANRVYEYEIMMLVDAIENVGKALEYIPGDDSLVHKRMPHELEQQVLDRFEERKRQLHID